MVRTREGLIWLYYFPFFLLSLKLEKKAKGKLQKQICPVVLDHFEKQYTAELGDAWSSVRSVVWGHGRKGRDKELN